MVNQQNLMITNSDENRTLLLSKDKCDKYDYIAAVGCGIVGGLIDIFFVGIPGNSVLGNWTDKQVDNVVMTFARKAGWNPRVQNVNNVKSAIGFLEKNFKVNYDQRYTSDVGGAFNMNTKNHHLMSLGHSPDILGLFFSVLNQFMATSTFIADGQIITINTETFELRGNNFISKLFCGVVNWIGHIMSDIAGSSGSRGNGGRGIGIGAPFYELFQFCKFGKFSVGKAKQDLAVIATRAFENGYDFRFGVTTAIPVVVTDLCIKLIWAIRRYYQFEYPIKECVPTMKHSDLRVMLLWGNGTLCLMDGLDAVLRSGGNMLSVFMRLNLVAWSRFTMLVLKELCIRLHISSALQRSIDAYKQINEALEVYLEQLENIDIELFKKETEAYINVVNVFESSSTLEELNKNLLEVFDRLGINKPWKGDFNEHMSNRNATLVFK